MMQLVHARRVDYVHGNCMMLSRKVIDAIKGFDMQFDPEYNAVDVAMATAAANYSVILQPFAAVSGWCGSRYVKPCHISIGPITLRLCAGDYSRWAQVV
jgi:hypothetical protein